MAKDKERIEILLEEIRGSVKAIAEGHEVLGNRIDRLDNKLTDQISFADKKVDFLAQDVKDIKKIVNRIDQRLEEHICQPAHLPV